MHTQTCSEIPGFEVPLHRSLTEPILLAGAPRTVTIINGTIAASVGLGLRAGFKSYSNVTIPCETPRHEPDACYECPCG